MSKFSQRLLTLTMTKMPLSALGIFKDNCESKNNILWKYSLSLFLENVLHNTKSKLNILVRI